MSNTCRLMVAMLIAASFFGASVTAQESAIDEVAKSANEQIGQNSYSLDELILLYSNESGRTVIHDPRKLQGKVSVRSPLAGSNATAEDLLLAGLAEFRLTLVSNGKFDRIIPLAEAGAHCSTVLRSELADLPAQRVVRLVVQLKNAESNAVRGAIQNMLSRQGGMASPVRGRGDSGAIILADVAGNLIEVLKLIDELDSFEATVSKVVTLKNVKASDINGAVNAAAGKRVDVGWTANEKTAVLTGSDTDVARLAAVISQLDVK